MSKRKICVVTGTRAEYGLLYWLMKEIQQDPKLELQVVACAMHLSSLYGYTIADIEKDGFKINEKVDMLLSSDTPTAIAKSIGLGVIGFADAFERLNPDIIVLLGDRFEILAAAQAAMCARIPIAHIHGGESSEGQIDEVIRHSITKMSHIHFTASEAYRERVIQMGENPRFVYAFGALGVENISRAALKTKQQLEQELKLKIKAPLILGTYHPVTLKKDSAEKGITEFLKALEHFQNGTIVLTKPNADPGNRVIHKKIDDFVKRNPQHAYAYTSLGSVNYLSMMKVCDVVVGNSSSGIIEAPALKKACVNIGDRQKGRLAAKSIIHCGENRKEMIPAIEKSLSKKFQAQLKGTVSLYGQGRVSKKMTEVLKKVDLKPILFKTFHRT